MAYNVLYSEHPGVWQRVHVFLVTSKTTHYEYCVPWFQPGHSNHPRNYVLGWFEIGRVGRFTDSRPEQLIGSGLWGIYMCRSNACLERWARCNTGQKTNTNAVISFVVHMTMATSAVTACYFHANLMFAHPVISFVLISLKPLTSGDWIISV